MTKNKPFQTNFNGFFDIYKLSLSLDYQPERGNHMSVDQVFERNGKLFIKEPFEREPYHVAIFPGEIYRGNYGEYYYAESLWDRINGDYRVTSQIMSLLSLIMSERYMVIYIKFVLL